MNAKIKELIDKGIIKISKGKPKKEHIEIFVEGDINDADYVRDTYNYSVDDFTKNIDLFKKVVNEYDGYIDDVEDEELQDFLRDISPSSPSDGCEVHTIDEITFKYHDGEGNVYPITL